MTTQHELAVRFRSLHDPAAPLALANAWDAASARIVAASGAAAIATSSTGVAWSLGAPDGNRVERDEALALLARITGAVAGLGLPVTADIESGFGTGPQAVADTVARVLATGAVGVNIEDSDPEPAPDRPLRPVGAQAERLAAARGAADRAGIPLYLNARVDVFLHVDGEPSRRMDEALARARAYLEAGASGVFVPGVADPALIGELAAGIDAPLNISGGPAAPSVAELGALGVARVSLGSAVAEAAYQVAVHAARELLETGTYQPVRDAVEFRRMNALMRGEA